MNALTGKITAVSAQVFICGCCNDACDMDDHMGEKFTEEHTAAVKAAFGSMVCFACADEFEVPEDNDAPYHNADEAYEIMKAEAV